MPVTGFLSLYNSDNRGSPKAFARYLMGDRYDIFFLPDAVSLGDEYESEDFIDIL